MNMGKSVFPWRNAVISKKNAFLSALMISTLGAVSSAYSAEIYNHQGNKVDLYGQIYALHYFSKDTTFDGDSSYVRLGFKGETKINDQLTGYGQWEYNFQDNNPEDSESALSGNATRIGYAGIKHAYLGSLDYGRKYGIMYDAISWTDMLPDFTGISGYKDNFMNGRRSGELTYRNNNLGGLIQGLNIGLQYQGKSDEGDIRNSSGEGWGTSVAYESDSGLGIVGAYSLSDRTLIQNQAVYGHGSKGQAWVVAVKYDKNNIFLSALYSQTLNETPVTNNYTSVSGLANKAVTNEYIAAYQFDSGLRPGIGYMQSKGIDIEGIGDVWLYKYAALTTAYYFNQNMSVYTGYKINLLKPGNKLGINTHDVFTVGMVYQF